MERGTKFAADHRCDALIADSSEKLIDRVYQLEEGGGTALGPAVACALGMMYENCVFFF